MLARRFLDSFSKLCVSAPATSLIRQNVALNQPTRFIHKHLLAEPGSRWKTIGNIWMVETPEKYTIKKLPLYKLAGRDPVTGRVVVSTRGGGHKKKYRWVDMHRNGPKEGPPLVERVIAIKYDPCRTARIALVASGNNVRYIIATTTMKPGDLISTSGHIPRIAIRPKEGDAHPLGALPLGTRICCVEQRPGQGATFAINAGTSALLLRKVGDRCVVQLASKTELALRQECMATVGQVSNPEHSSIPIGSPNRLRWLGYRPRSGLWHRKDGRFGRKIYPVRPAKEVPDHIAKPPKEMKLTVKNF